MMMMAELLSSGPETVVLNADAVYVTTYSVLHLTTMLHRSDYFTTAEKSLPVSEVLVNPFHSGPLVKSPAPLYFRTLWRYRNCIIIIIIFFLNPQY